MCSTLLKIKKIIHPLILMLLRTAVKFKLNINYNNETLKVINKSGPVIFVANHSNRHDFPCLSKVIKKHFVVLSDIGIRGSIGGLMCDLNGVIYVKRDDKSSRKQSKKEMIEVLRKGFNILIFPEGTWNLTPNLPMLPFSWGIIEVAQITGVSIIPIVLEYDYGSNFCDINIGNPFNISKEESLNAVYTELRDTMATLRWSLWEHKGVFERANVSEKNFSNLISHIKDEYTRLDYDFEEKIIFNPTCINCNADVFAHLYNMCPSRQNAFLFNKRLKGYLK